MPRRLLCAALCGVLLFAGCMSRQQREIPQEPETAPGRESSPPPEPFEPQDPVSDASEPEQMADAENEQIAPAPEPVTSAKLSVNTWLSNGDLYSVNFDKEQAAFTKALIFEGVRDATPKYNQKSSTYTVLTENGDIYDLHNLDSTPELVQRVTGTSDIKRLLGNNLVLKNDNSLWHYNSSALRSSEDSVTADSLSWRHIMDDVVDAHSQNGYNSYVILTGSGQLNEVVIAEDSVSSTPLTDENKTVSSFHCLPDFYVPNQSGRLGIVYDDGAAEFYQIKRAPTYDSDWKVEFEQKDFHEEGVRLMRTTEEWIVVLKEDDTLWFYPLYGEDDPRLVATLPSGISDFQVFERRHYPKDEDVGYRYILLTMLDQDDEFQSMTLECSEFSREL